MNIAKMFGAMLVQLSPQEFKKISVAYDCVWQAQNQYGMNEQIKAGDKLSQVIQDVFENKSTSSDDVMVHLILKAIRD